MLISFDQVSTKARCDSADGKKRRKDPSSAVAGVSLAITAVPCVKRNIGSGSIKRTVSASRRVVKVSLTFCLI
jgi:hypothetical protein